MSPKLATSVVAAIGVTLLSASAVPAGTYLHKRHALMRTTPASVGAPPQPFMFYPQDIEGGVSGNLPFNNQIRKHTDPLNANGGR